MPEPLAQPSPQSLWASSAQPDLGASWEETSSPLLPFSSMKGPQTFLSSQLRQAGFTWKWKRHDVEGDRHPWTQISDLTKSGHSSQLWEIPPPHPFWILWPLPHPLLLLTCFVLKVFFFCIGFYMRLYFYLFMFYCWQCYRYPPFTSIPHFGINGFFKFVLNLILPQ